MATQGNGANIRDILKRRSWAIRHFAAFPCKVLTYLLPPKLAMTMALIVHELATNSANTVRWQDRSASWQYAGPLPMEGCPLTGR